MAKKNKKELSMEIEAFRQSLDSYSGRVIISSEWLVRSSPHLISRLFPKDETRIIVYVRDQISYLVSYYQEMIVSLPITECINEFAKKERNLNFYKLINRWAKVFGRENIEVRLYERDQLHNQDIVEDFLQILGIEPDWKKYKINDSNKNPGLGGDLLEFKRQLNSIIYDSKEQWNRLRKTLRYLSEQNPEYRTKPVINKKIRKKIMKKYYKSNQKLFRTYFHTNNYLFSKKHEQDEQITTIKINKFYSIIEEIKETNTESHDYILDISNCSPPHLS